MAIMRHLIEAIRERFGIDEPLPTTADEYVTSFPNWLFRAEHRANQLGIAILIVIDAVNQLDEAGRRMAWLPKTIPPGVKLVISTTPGEPFDRLSELGWEELEVTPLEDENVRRSIVVRYLGEFHKGISSEQLRRLTSDVKARSPLYLRVVAEELRLHGEHETLDTMIDRCVKAVDLLALFEVVLDRIEHDHGAADVRELLGAIRASRTGLSEAELLEVTGVSRLELSRLLFVFDYHLIHRDGLVGFFHEFLQRAVETRYMPTDEIVRARHAGLGRYFSQQPYDGRRSDEEPWQWQQAGEHERLCSSIGSIDMFRLLGTTEKQYELLGYWLALGERYDMVDIYRRSFEEWEESHSDRGELLDLLRQLGQFFIAASRLDAAGEMFQRELDIVTHSEASDAEMAGAYNDVGSWQFHRGLYREAGTSYSEALRLLERSGEGEGQKLCGLLDSLSAVHYSLAEFEEAERIARRSLRIIEGAYGDGHVTSVDRLHTLGAMISATGNREEAIVMLRRALDICVRELGSRHVRTNRERYNLGALLHNDGRYDEAVEQYEEALVNLRTSLGEHLLVANVLYNLGNSMIALARYHEAERTLQEALTMQTKLLGEGHLAVLATGVNIAVTRLRGGDAPEAARMLARILPVRALAIGWEHPNLQKNFRTFTQALRAAELVDPQMLEELETGESQESFERLCQLAGL
jgi:nephrocystin-3